MELVFERVVQYSVVNHGIFIQVNMILSKKMVVCFNFCC